MEKQRTLRTLATVFEKADLDGSGTLSFTEFLTAFETQEETRRLLHQIELPLDECEELFTMLDQDGTGEVSIDEFFKGCVRLKGQAHGKDMVQVAVGLSNVH